MSYLFKIVLVLSIVLNLIALWALFHYVMYGGSPLGEIKRKLFGSSKTKTITIPYENENNTIKKEAAEGKIDSLRVVFYGASITHNWNLGKYFPEIHPLNRGVGGFVPDLLTKYKSNVLDLRPRAVVIKLCAINIRPQIPMSVLKDGLDMMVGLARAYDIIPITTTIIPSAKPAAHIGDFSVIDSLKSYNEWVREYSVKNNLGIIDYATAIQDENGFLPRKYAKDPVHINEEGYKVLSNTARPIIYDIIGVK